MTVRMNRNHDIFQLESMTFAKLEEGNFSFIIIFIFSTAGALVVITV